MRNGNQKEAMAKVIAKISQKLISGKKEYYYHN